MTTRGLILCTTALVLLSATLMSRQAIRHERSPRGRKGHAGGHPDRRAEDHHPLEIKPTLKPSLDVSLTSQSVPL